MSCGFLMKVWWKGVVWAHDEGVVKRCGTLDTVVIGVEMKQEWGVAMITKDRRLHGTLPVLLPLPLIFICNALQSLASYAVRETSADVISVLSPGAHAMGRREVSEVHDYATTTPSFEVTLSNAFSTRCELHPVLVRLSFVMRLHQTVANHNHEA